MNIKYFMAALIAFAFIASSSVSFASDVTFADGVNYLDGGTGGEVSISKNVRGKYMGAATGYAMATYHLNGSKEYGSGSNSGSIYYLDCVAPSCGTAWTTQVGDTVFATGDYTNPL